MAAPMLEFRTQGFNPYAVNRVYALGLTAAGVQLEKTFDTNDAQYDLAWSELNENQLLVACGDGSVKLFDLSVNEFPVMNFHEHKRETFCVCWNPVTKDTFLSSSWDGTVKIWSPTRNHSLKTLPVGSCAYSASFCPLNPALISAASTDSCVRLFDLRTPVSAKYHLVATIPVHVPSQQESVVAGPRAPVPPTEVLTHDWNKYRDSVVAAAGVDRVIRTFDVRHPLAGPLSYMDGHQFAVRRLAWSPHAADLLVSASYDMTVRLWSDSSAAAPPQPAGMPPPPSTPGRELGVMNRHTEFATGVDWCLFGAGGWVASCAWDERVLLWDANAFLRR